MAKISLFVAVLTCLASPAFAQTFPTLAQAPEAFKKLDASRDGVVTLAEWKAAGRLERGFYFVDANGDGKVTLEELKAALAKYQPGG